MQRSRQFVCEWLSLPQKVVSEALRRTFYCDLKQMFDLFIYSTIFVDDNYIVRELIFYINFTYN